MRNKKTDDFAITLWDGMNIFLSVATLLTTIIFTILLVLSFVKKIGSSEQSFIIGLCGVFASLASAFFIAWIMRIYDLIKKENRN